MQLHYFLASDWKCCLGMLLIKLLVMPIKKFCSMTLRVPMLSQSIKNCP